MSRPIRALAAAVAAARFQESSSGEPGLFAWAALVPET